MMALVAALLVASQESKDPLDRLVGELGSRSKERQEMARFALRAYGAAALDRLLKDGIDASFIGLRGPSEEDQQIQEKLKAIRVSIDMQQASLPAVVDYLREISGLDIKVDAGAIPKADQEMISFKVADIVLDGALRLMLIPRQKRYTVRDGVVLITAGPDRPEAAPPRAPVRLRAGPSLGRKEAAALSGESPDERDRAMEGLRRLGFAAEPALWEALESSDAESRGRAVELLRELYTPEPRIVPPAVERELRKKTVSFESEAASPARALEFLSDQAGVSILVDARMKLPERTIPYSWKGLPADQLLLRITQPMQLGAVFGDEWILVTNEPGRVQVGRPAGPVWTKPDRARSIEDLIGRIASEDAARRGAALLELSRSDASILGPLLEASRILPPGAAGRCRAAREGYIEEHGLWMADEPSGAERQKLSPAQRELLEKRIDLRAVDQPLLQVLKGTGLAATVKTNVDLRLSLWARQLKRGTVLQAITRPYGLDFALDGEAVVIDTAAKIREVLAR
jgi:hypothetical protein